MEDGLGMTRAPPRGLVGHEDGGLAGHYTGGLPGHEEWALVGQEHAFQNHLKQALR